MLSTRDIQRKIRTVRNIQQITRAMKTVSSIKLRKAEERINAARPYAEALRDMVSGLGGADYPHPLLEVREVRNVGVVAISADKGLAGSYNANLIRRTLEVVRSYERANTVPIGRKITDAFRFQHIESEMSVPLLGAEPEFRRLAAVADRLGELYVQGTWDQVDLIYTEFGGGVTVQRLLPILPPAEAAPVGDVIYVPDAATIIGHILPRYLRVLLYTAALSAVAAEHASRVTAMTLATDNAEDVIARLTMDYNKARQSAITSELVDIIGAVEALT